MVRDDSGFVVVLIIAIVAGLALAGLASVALVSSVAATPDPVKPALVTYDVT